MLFSSRVADCPGERTVPGRRAAKLQVAQLLDLFPTRSFKSSPAVSSAENKTSKYHTMTAGAMFLSGLPGIPQKFAGNRTAVAA